MPRAIVDPREVRRFSAFLMETVRNLRGTKTAVDREFKDLQAVWKDKKYSQFEKAFENTLCVNNDETPTAQ